MHNFCFSNFSVDLQNNLSWNQLKSNENLLLSKTYAKHSFYNERNLLAYRKVMSSSLSRLVAHPSIFRLFMTGKFDAYVLWPLAKRVQYWIVDRSTACAFMVDGYSCLATDSKPQVTRYFSGRIQCCYFARHVCI